MKLKKINLICRKLVMKKWKRKKCKNLKILIKYTVERKIKIMH